MIKINNIYTDRLHLRRWKEEDTAAFASLNADPIVMEYFPSVLSPEESNVLANRMDSSFERWGYGWWAVELKETRTFIGCVGLSVPSFEAHFTPCVEVGWRLAKQYWGKGYATEAAQAAIDVGFKHFGLKQIVSFTVPANQRSRAVMERLGMTHQESDDFAHPKLPADHPLSKHVLYRLSREQWREHSMRNDAKIKIITRQAHPSDAAALVAAEREVAQIPGRLISQPNELVVENFRSTLERLSNNKHGYYLIAESHSKIVGHGCLEIAPLKSISHVAQLKSLVVHAGWQNKGIGTQLLKQLIECAKNSGTIEKIELSVRSTNEQAIELYKACGFVEEGRLKDHIKLDEQQYIDDILMALFVK